MVPNIDGTMGHKIKPENTQVMEHSALFSIQQTDPSTIPSRKCHDCIWASVEQIIAEISERRQKC